MMTLLTRDRIDAADCASAYPSDVFFAHYNALLSHARASVERIEALDRDLADARRYIERLKRILADDYGYGFSEPQGVAQ